MNSRSHIVGSLIAIGFLMLASVVGCVSHKDRSSLLKGITTTQVTLKGEHTRAPDLQLTVPEGFEIEWEPRHQYDKFFIFMASDTGDVQRGMIVFDITPTPRWIIKDTSEFNRSEGSIGKDDVIWREVAIKRSKTDRLFQREMVQSELLKDLRSPDGVGELTVHAFVVGSDSLLVERLTAAVETLKRMPPHPNL